MLQEVTVPVNQSAPGTVTLAAALSGHINQVLGFMLYAQQAGTWRFSDGNDLTGPVGTVANAAPIVVQSSSIPLVTSRNGFPLNLVTTGGSYKGFVIVLTAPEYV